MCLRSLRCAVVAAAGLAAGCVCVGGDEPPVLVARSEPSGRLLDTYLAAPVLEVFPRALVTNWMAVFSTAERPALYWSNDAVPPGLPGVMNASNPVAYGNNLFWERSWRSDYPLTRQQVDRFYMQLLLRMVSADTANRLRFRPECRSVPWVARWCPDVPDEGLTPILSRQAYREALRHLWLRGVDGMQIFNATRPGYEDEVFAEVEDAVAVYDELLEHAEFLEHGAVLNTAVPDIRDDGLLWSGLRLGDRALVRAVKQGDGEATATVEIWPGQPTTIAAARQGRTLLLVRHQAAPPIPAAAPAAGERPQAPAALP